jgi:surface protein
MADFIQQVASTAITDQNIHQLVKLYLENPSQLPPDLQNKRIGEWDVSRVTNMSKLFFNHFNHSSFDEPLDKWNVSNVTNMSNMFNGCSSFDQHLTWDVGNVTDMSHMFEGCFRFDQPLTWNVRNVTNMSHMFDNAYQFRGEGLEAWNVSNVTKMSYMFNNSRDFDQPLKWNVSNVINMAHMFDNAYKFRGEGLEAWNVSNVTDMRSMFYKCRDFDQPLNTWNVSNVTDMRSMFDGCESFDQDISSWEQRFRPYVRKDYIFHNCPIRDDYKPLRFQFRGITDDNIQELVHQYFANASMLTTKLRDIPLGKWDVSRVTNMSWLFYPVDGEENDFSGEGLEAWDVSNVTNMEGMFNECFYFNQPIGSWNVRNVTNMTRMFEGCESFDQDISSWEQRLRPDVVTDDIFEECPIRDDYKPLRLRGNNNNRQVRVRVDPFQVHKGAKKINYKKLCDFLQEHTREVVPGQSVDLDTFGKFIETAMTNFIRDSGVDGQASLENIMVSRLRDLQYDQFGIDLLRTCKYALYYVERQSSGFKRAYLETFLLDCTQAYEGEEGGMTCAQGALERIIISLVTAVQTMVSLGNQKPEWETLIAIIEADPAKMIPSYIQDWYKAHNSKGTGAFAAVTSGDMRRADLRTYLLQRFPNETALIDQQIQKVADHIGYDDDVFQYGGRPTIRKRAIARATRRRTSQKRKKTRRRARK